MNGKQPLELFGLAKSKINAIYERLDSCITDASNFYSDPKLNEEILRDVDHSQLPKLSRSIKVIKQVLARDRMKVAFFGRTSNGKSTTINAILHDEVLPAGIGHTTSCFIQIEGTHKDSPYIEIIHKNKNITPEKQPIEALATIANAQETEALDDSAYVRVYWPISRCPLLKYDVVLLDSPGISYKKKLSDCIDEHCQDADVFVFVSYAESSLDEHEENFFHKISEKISKPSLFVLVNRWDAIARAPNTISRVRKQLTDNAVRFLSEELQTVDPEEAKQRTFFVSALETLETRINGDVDKHLFGYEDRLQEFIQFEHKFEECLSRTAVREKFKKHADKSHQFLEEFGSTINSTYNNATKLKCEKKKLSQETQKTIGDINKAFFDRRQEIQKKLSSIREEIKSVYAFAFEQKVKKLARIVEEFDEEFVPHDLKEYKRRFYNYVEKNLKDSIEDNFHKSIRKHLDNFVEDMTSVSEYMKEEAQSIRRIIAAKKLYSYYDIFELLSYKPVYDNFHEDLEFHFLFDLNSLIRRRMEDYSSKSTQLPFTLSLPFLMFSKTQFFTTALVGAVFKVVGWKAIGAIVGIFGGTYFYSYLTWNTAAKKKAFRKQFVSYATSRLRKIKGNDSIKVASSAHERLSTCFAEVEDVISRKKSILTSTLKCTEFLIEKLSVCERFCEKTLGEKNLISQECVLFFTSFLV